MGHNVFREIMMIDSNYTFNQIINALVYLDVETDECYYWNKEDNLISFTRSEPYSFDIVRFFSERGVKGKFQIGETYLDEHDNYYEYEEVEE